MDAVDAGLRDSGLMDTGAIDALVADTGVIDSGFVDAGFVDGGVVTDTGVAIDTGVARDTGVVPDAGTPDVGLTQGGGIVISELLPRSSTYEWIEVHNTSASAIALHTYTVSISSRAALGALAIRAPNDPNGTSGTVVTLTSGAYAIGVANPQNPADIPATATFLIGTPGQLGTNALSDTGDVITLQSPTRTGDRLDFRAAATNPAMAIAPSEYPLVTDQSTQLDPSADVTGGETANDNGSAWCVQIFRGATPGLANHPCGALVISEVLYDYDSVTNGTDEGEEFVEIAGAAGASMVGIAVVRVEGSATGAGTIDGESRVTAARMGLDGLYVLADDDPGAGGMTHVMNADQTAAINLENGPDAIQLLRIPTAGAPVLLDALSYGTPATNTDTVRGLAIVEGTAAPDPSPTIYSSNLARSDSEVDTNANSADFRYDPSPTPGTRNGSSDFALASIAPNDAVAVASRTTTITLSGTDFTDQMVLTFGQTPTPSLNCPVPSVANTLTCRVTFPSGGTAGRVDVTLAARPEHGGRSTLTGGFTWTTAQNETNAAGECDYCNLQFPAALAVSRGMTTADVFGQIFEAGRTDTTTGGAAPGISAELGFGASGSDPRTTNWTWFPATFNVEAGINNNNDEYRGRMTAPSVAGTYSYTYRFSLDQGLTWTYADVGGAGSNGGADFSAANLGVMTVN
jgi:hypothetical protein